MKNILEYIRIEIAKVCEIEDGINFICESPKDQSHGDFSTNIAMVCSKLYKSPPMELAEKFLPKIQSLPFVRECCVAKPGFINLRIKEFLLNEMMSSIFEAKTLANIGNGEKINIEYVSANPTGPLHVGHLRGAIYGDVLSSLLSKTGFDVTKEYYINDAGNQISILGKSVWIRYRQLLGDTLEVEDGCYPAEYIVDIAKEVRAKYGDSLTAENPIFAEYATHYNLNWIKSTLAKLKIQHDVFSSEKEIVNSSAIEGVFKDLWQKDLIYKGIPEKPRKVDEESWEPKECVLFKTKQFGDDQDRVVQKNDGSYTYCVPDMVYNRNKINRGFNSLVMVLGADHLGYVSRLQAMTKAIAKDDFHLDIKICQIVKFLKDGNAFKMSKRAGTFVTVDDILEDVHVDIIRFIMLTKKNDVHMDFDVEKVKEQTKENPIFYIQYAYSRLSSIIRKSEIQTVDFTAEINPHFISISKKIVEFPSILNVAVRNHEPHHLAFFAYALAGELHSAWTLGNSNPHARFIIDGNTQHNQSSMNIIFSTKRVFEFIFDIFNIEPLTSM